MTIMKGRTYHNCDECNKPKSCSVIELRQGNDTTKRSYVFFVCDNCLNALSDVGGTKSLLKEVVDL